MVDKSNYQDVKIGKSCRHTKTRVEGLILKHKKKENFDLELNHLDSLGSVLKCKNQNHSNPIPIKALRFSKSI